MPISPQRIEALAASLRNEGRLVFGDTPPQYRVTRATAAVVLGVSEKTLRNRASQGLEPDYYRVLGRVQYGLAELIRCRDVMPDDLAA